jgi:predicted nucleotidyltransferase
MNRDEAISRLQQHEADLKRLGVEHLYMFGSTARGEAGDDSDVDPIERTRDQSDFRLGLLGVRG